MTDQLLELLPEFEVDWCSVHGDIGPMESIDGHARKAHGSSAKDIRKARKVIKRALVAAKRPTDE
jgi:hypothetical protein